MTARRGVRVIVTVLGYGIRPSGIGVVGARRIAVLLSILIVVILGPVLGGQAGCADRVECERAKRSGQGLQWVLAHDLAPYDEGWAQQPGETSTTGDSTRTAAPERGVRPHGARPAAHRR